MNRKLKKGLTGTFILGLSLAVGCSGGGGATPPAAGKEAAKETSAPAAKNTAPVEIELMTNLFQEAPSMSNEYYSELQKMTNSKLNVLWVPDNQYEAKFDLVMASGELPEVILGNDYNKPNLVNAINQGAFWDLTAMLGDFSAYPNLRDNMTPGSWEFVKYNGKIMGIPRSRSSIDQGLMVRKDWMTKLNIPVPTTVDEFTEALRKIAKSDPDGNGKNDTIPLAANDPFVNALTPAFGILDPQFDKDKGLIFHQLTDQQTNLVEWFRNAYAEGLVAKDFGLYKSNELQDFFKTGKAFATSQSSYYASQWTPDVKKTDPNAEFMVLPPMKGPAGYTVQLDSGTRGGFYISKKVPADKVKSILEYFNKTASKEVTEFGYFGKEGVHHNVVNGEKVFTDLGKQQIAVTALSPLTPAFYKWGKVDSAQAPKALNDQRRKEVEKYEEVGKVNPFRWLSSPTWVKVWPNYSEEYKSMYTKTIVGQVSMDDYKKFVDKVKNDPEVKKAFKEFADDYNKRAPKK